MPEEKIWIIGTDGEARLERRSSQRNSNGIPKIVPLPFKVPSDDDFADNSSSVATFAEEDPSEKEKRRRSKHLSAGSLLIKRLSQRSLNSLPSPSRSSRHLGTGEGGPSVEDLVIPHGEMEDDRASSIAATMDGLSDDEEMRSVRSSLHYAPDTTEVAGPAKYSEIVHSKDVGKLVMEPEITKNDEPRGTDDANATKEVAGEAPQNLTASTDSKPESELATPEQKKSASNVSAIDTKPSSITKERLPAQLSRVVMSYRTNEWAKHLSQADAPDQEELKLAEYTTESQSNSPTETAVPVKFEELQQTAESSTRRSLAPSRSASQTSAHPPAPTRSNSSLSRTALERSDSTTSAYLTPTDGLNRSSSQQSLSSLKAINTSKYRSVSSPIIPQPIVESPIEEQFSTFPTTTQPTLPSSTSNRYSSAPTLISKRDSMLRQKYLPQQALASTPEYPSSQNSRQQSDTSSMHNYDEEIDENIPLSTRRELIRQSSLQTSSSNLSLAQVQNLPHLQRQSTLPSPAVREAKLASWRASVQTDLAANNNSPFNVSLPYNSSLGNGIGASGRTSQLWSEKEREERRRMEEDRIRRERERIQDERMRRGDMLGAHREALRKMQRGASIHG